MSVYVVGFANWAEFLAYARGGGTLLYQAPLDSFPSHIRVEKVFKNGKVRIDPLSNESGNFTADAGHLSRMLRPSP